MSRGISRYENESDSSLVSGLGTSFNKIVLLRFKVRTVVMKG